MDGQALLPTTADKMLKKARRLPLPSVQVVCLWALINAFSIVTGHVIAAVVPFTCSPSSWVFPCIKVTEAQGAQGSAIMRGILWCAAPQTAAAAAALLLPRQRCRRPLALVAAAATAAFHFLLARFVFLVLAADPGYLYMRVFGGWFDAIYAVFDLLCFLGLLMGGEGEGGN